VGRVSPYTLRHTFATRLYRETDKIRLGQKALGHSDLSTTMIYTHVVDEELEGAMKDLWQSLDRPEAGTGLRRPKLALPRPAPL